MDKIITATNELREYLETLPEVQEYFRLKSLLESNEELKQLRLNILDLESKGLIEEKENLQAIYNNRPLVNNFEIYKDEVKALLRKISDVISE